MWQPKFLSLVFLCAVFCWGCGGDDTRYIPDVSKVSAKMEVQRFERDFFAMDSMNMASAMQQLNSKHPEFAPIFINDVLGGGFAPDSIANTRGFLSYPYSRWLYDTTQLVYPNSDALQADMQKMMQYYNYYFPNDSAPIHKLYTFISIYKYGIIVMDDYVAVGLDFFLGEQHKDYQGVENLRHAYIRRTLTPAHLVPQVGYAIANDIVETVTPLRGNKLIDFMLFNGKKFYLTQQLLPHTPDSLIYKFSAYQLEYCEKSEDKLYEHLAKQLGLYSDKIQDFRSTIFEGPFNPDYGNYGNSASWLGAQMVTQYANRLRQEMSKSGKEKDPQKLDIAVLQKVLMETEAQEFLKKYKPRAR